MKIQLHYDTEKDKYFITADGFIFLDSFALDLIGEPPIEIFKQLTEDPDKVIEKITAENFLNNVSSSEKERELAVMINLFIARLKERRGKNGRQL